VNENQPSRQDRDALTAIFVENSLRLAALALLLYIAFSLVSPFITITIWSVVIAVALYPAYEWLARLIGGRRRLAAALMTLICLLVVIGPATWLALDLIESLRAVSAKLDLSTLAVPPPPAGVKDWPLVGERIYTFWDLAATNLQAAFANIAPQLKPLGSMLLRIGADTGTAIVKFFVSIIVAGFLLAPAPALADALRKFASRLVSDRGAEFLGLAVATIRTVSRGVVGISVLQAFLAGLGLVVAGVPGASLLTTAVLVLGIVQVGPTVVLLPVVIWSWFAMPPAHALLFTLYMVPVNLLDNILRPVVMGRGLNTPMLVILIGVIGGTLAYGITGLFLGPIVLAVIWELFSAWIGERSAQEH